MSAHGSENRHSTRFLRRRTIMPAEMSALGPVSGSRRAISISSVYDPTLTLPQSGLYGCKDVPVQREHVLASLCGCLLVRVPGVPIILGEIVRRFHHRLDEAHELPRVAIRFWLPVEDAESPSISDLKTGGNQSSRQRARDMGIRIGRAGHHPNDAIH